MHFVDLWGEFRSIIAAFLLSHNGENILPFLRPGNSNIKTIIDMYNDI